MDEKEKLIIETLKEKGKAGLKELNISNEDIDKVVTSIDKKLVQLNMEQTLVISKELGYNLPIVCNYNTSMTYIPNSINKLGTYNVTCVCKNRILYAQPPHKLITLYLIY